MSKTDKSRLEKLLQGAKNILLPSHKKYRNDSTAHRAMIHASGALGAILLGQNAVDITSYLNSKAVDVISFGAKISEQRLPSFSGHLTDISNFLVGPTSHYLLDSPVGLEALGYILAIGGGIISHKKILPKVADGLHKYVTSRKKVKKQRIKIGKTIGLGLLSLALGAPVGASFLQGDFKYTGVETVSGHTEFRYTGELHTSQDISTLFEYWDDTHGSNCQETDPSSVYFEDNGEMYIKAKCDTTGFTKPPVKVPTGSCLAVYAPNSPEAIELFSDAAESLGLPRSWGSSDALHNILRNESGGVVGIPNYTIQTKDGKNAKQHPESWTDIHEELKTGALKPGSARAKSSATGVGQLLLSNVMRYYPSGADGIGDCHEEAIGMLAYIEDRYNDPETAWRLYGTLHEGY